MASNNGRGPDAQRPRDFRYTDTIAEKSAEQALLRSLDFANQVFERETETTVLIDLILSDATVNASNAALLDRALGLYMDPVAVISTIGAVSSGAVSLVLASDIGAEVGDGIYIEEGTFETRLITAVSANGLTLTVAATSGAHAADARVALVKAATVSVFTQNIVLSN